MFDIKDKVAIVTGGASGIGLATVEMILEKGGKPVIADYNEEGGKKEAERLGLTYSNHVTKNNWTAAVFVK